MKEAMRIHPGVGFPLERLVPENGASLLGYDLAAGTNVSMTAPVVHYDKDVFGPDADKFRPERWLESDAEHIRVMDRSLLTVNAPRALPDLCQHTLDLLLMGRNIR